jgi:hypothetical protein
LNAVDHRTVDLQLESEPAGAEAKTSLGPSCRTPCALPIGPIPDFTVTFTLDGYQPQTVPVKVIRSRARPDWVGKTRADPELEPNPIHAALAAIPPPEPPKPPAKKKPRVAAKPAAAAPSSTGQTSSAGFAPTAATRFPPPPR